MTSRIIAVEPFDFVIFGGAGDLAYRKLLPALYERHLDGQIPTVTRIIGVSRRHMSDDDYREATRRALNEHASDGTRDEAVLETFLNRLHFVPVDATADAGWDDLAAMLQGGPGAHPRLLPRRRAGAVRHHLRQDRRKGPDHAAHAGGDREADRPRPQVGPRGQRSRRHVSSAKARSTASTTISAKRRCRT